LFAAIFNAGGEPVDLTFPAGGQTLENRPGHEAKSLGGGIALFSSRVGPADSSGEHGIQNLDGRLWLVGRIRLDARDELLRRISESGARRPAAGTDSLLCLQAYDLWGDRFVDSLFGDFAFLLWDVAKRSLVAVADRLGTHALFHARTGNSWFIGDRLEWVAKQAGLADRLDDYWIADFLSAGVTRELGRTVYDGVRRFAPAHLIRLNGTGASTRRYWRPGVVEPLQLPNDEAYIERFLDLLRHAIADRLPPASEKVGISMSGGLDSPLLAACTVAVAGDPARIVAECEHYEELMHIGEGHFASLAARRLGIDLRLRILDRVAYDPEWRERSIRTAEPCVGIMNAFLRRAWNSESAASATVWFHGEGPDTALWFERDAYLSWLRRNRRWRQLGSALVRYVAVKGVGGWAQSFRRHFGRTPAAPAYYGLDHLPEWLNRDLVNRLHLAERARSLSSNGESAHPWHPQAVAALTSPMVQQLFSDHLDEELENSIAWRHPYLDVRVLEFMFAAPPIPWAWKKHLLRRAGRGLLPDELLRREKTPLPLDPDSALLRRHGMPHLLGPADLTRYVDVSALPSVEAPDRDLRGMNSLLALDYWLAAGRL
jgi:asparagine synthase (glutamine-hydrolysing)